MLPYKIYYVLYIKSYDHICNGVKIFIILIAHMSILLRKQKESEEIFGEKMKPKRTGYQAPWSSKKERDQ